MSTTLVTGIYFSDREGEFGGRSWQEQYYFSSLQNIYNFGLPIVVHCDDRGYHKVKRYMEYLTMVTGENRWKIIKSEIGDFKYKDIIREHREACIKYQTWEAEERKKTNPDEPGFFHARCEILCHRKLYFVKSVAEKNPFNTENFCWIDSGITHWALTPFSKGGVEINNFFDKRHYWPWNKNNIYTPEIGKGLDNLITKHGMFEFKHSNIWYNSYHVNHLKNLLMKEYGFSQEDASMRYQLVGGVIGLQPKEFDKLFSFYEKGLETLAATRPPESDFFTEEIILSAYYLIRKPFTIHFQDWPHDGENDPAFVDYGAENEARKSMIQFYKVWDILKTHAPEPTPEYRSA